MDCQIEIFNDVFAQRDKFIRFAYYYVYDRPAAEDIVMDSFVYWWENRESLRDESNIPAYILTVVKHKCLDFLKLKRIHADTHSKMLDDAVWEINMAISSLEAFDPYKIMAGELKAAVDGALAKLPGKTRRVFLMSRMEEMTYAEISEREKISVKVVEYHISKALRHLRSELSDLLPLALLIYSFYYGNTVLPPPVLTLINHIA